jgi:putative DNA primase/helicase
MLKPHYKFLDDLSTKLKKVPLSRKDIIQFSKLYEDTTEEEIDIFLEGRKKMSLAMSAIAQAKPEEAEKYKQLDILFIEENPDIAIYEQENNITFCKYENGVYKMLSNQQIELMVDGYFIKHGLMAHRTSTKNIKDTIARIARSLTIQNKRRFTDEIMENQPHLCNMIDGLLDPITGNIEEHRKDYFSLSQIEHSFNVEQNMDMFTDKFLANLEKASPGFVELMQDITGYILFDKGNSLEKFIVLYGPTSRNGKNAYTKILTGLIGKRYVSHLSLNTLCTPSAHAMRGIVGKRLNISDEVSGEYIRAGNLTSITGRGVVQINPKGKDDFSYQPICNFLLCANSQPKFMEDIGLQSRLLIVPFYHHMKEEDRIENFPELILKNEGTAILKWALEGYQRLIKNKKFLVTEESKRLLKQNNENNNDIINFLTNYALVTGKDDFVSKSDLFSSFLDFCTTENISYKHKRNTFFQSIEHYAMRHGGIEESRTSKERGYKGIIIPTGFETPESIRENYEDDITNNF